MCIRDSNGTSGTESPLLESLLRAEWGFRSLVISDWGAVRSVEAAAVARTDLAMPGPESPWSEGLVAAVRAGRADEADVDVKAVSYTHLDVYKRQSQPVAVWPRS